MHWKARSWTLIGLLLTVMTKAGLTQIATTQVADTIYHADGTVATGTLIISWPAFTTSAGDSIPSGSTSTTIGTGGALSVQLISNAGSIPMGSYYTVVYHLDDGSVSRQYWVVPVSSASVKVSAIESTVLPTSVAMQTVSKSYVDTAIAAALIGHPLDSTPYVLKAGDTMTGPLVLPADPVSATQAADKSYVDENVAALSSGLGQKVSTLPSATQIVAQPTGTQLGVNNLNGVEYASQYVSGRGNNGIANAVASPDCSNGCELNAEQDYTTELYPTVLLNSQTHLVDARGGRQADSYMNPVDVVGHGLSTAQAIDDVSTQSEASLFQQTGNQIPGAIGLAITQEGLAGGSNLYPQQIEDPPPYFKMGYSALLLKGTYNTQGQHGLVPEEIDCYGVGDCLIGSQFINASGGIRDSADEGAHPFDLEIHEDTKVYVGTCSAGCTTGSTSVMTVPGAGGGTQGDGRFLIDTNPAKTITNASTGGAIVSGNTGGPHATVQFSGTSLPVSVFLSAGQVILSQANDMAPGSVTFPIATTGVPTGYATNTAAVGASSGVACVVDQTNVYAPDNYEMAPYTIVDATHLQMTLNKPHQILATIAFGGLCGYGLEQTVDTANGIRQLFPVVGAYSSTGVYYAGGTTPVLGVMNHTSGFLNISASIASAVRTGNVVTVTTAGSLPTDVNGLTVSVAGVADSSYDGSFLATTIAANSFTYSQTGANSTSGGGAFSVLTGGFAFYPMAETLSVFDQAAKSVDGQMTLAPNKVLWATGDPVEQPHYYQEYISADTEYLGQSVPRPSVTSRAGLQYQQNNGPGLVGWSIQNAAPSMNYLGYGGTHSVPDGAYESTGIWLKTMNLGAGEQAVFAIHCNLHGCNNWNSGYNLFELDSSVGTDTVAYSPSASSLSAVLRGTAYSFTPEAFTAGTINVGTLNATTINGGSGVGVAIAGDIGGTDAAPLVTGIQGRPVAATAPTAGQSPTWNGSAYVPTTPSTFSRFATVPISGSGNFGDSTVACYGASGPLNCFGAQLQNDVPGTWLYDYGNPGDTTQGIDAISWLGWNPIDNFANPLITYEGGINDANAPGDTAGGINNAILSATAGVAHIAIPFANQIMSSNAASSTGTWTSVSLTALAPAVVGTIESSATNGSSRTYSLPASVHLVYFWGAANSNAGTFSVSVNGTLQTNLCTGTTTFDSFGCNGQAIVSNSTAQTIFAQVFGGNSGSSNSVVVTVTSATSSSNVVYDVGVATVPNGLASSALAGQAPIVGIQGVLREAGDNNSASTAAYNTAIQGVYTTLFNAGVTNIYFADVRNGVAAGTGYPAALAINTTTDYGGSAGCAGGASPLHPADCGYYHLAQLHESAAAAAGFPVFERNTGSRSSVQPAGPTFLPGAILPGDYSDDFQLNPMGVYASAAGPYSPLPGICFYQNGSVVNKKTCTANGGSSPRIAYEYSGSIGAFSMKIGYGGVGCSFSTNTANDTCMAAYNDVHAGSFQYAAVHLGAGPSNGSAIQPAVGNFASLSIDSQSAANGTIANSVSTTLTYMTAGTTGVNFPPCKADIADGVYGKNWLRWYVKDSTDSGPIVFTAYAPISDSVNGQSSISYSNIPANTVFQAQCSQGTATTSSIVLSELLPQPHTVVTGSLTLTAATSDNLTLTGLTTSSVCTFSPSNSTATGASILPYYAVASNTFTLNHAATVGSGATYGVICNLN